MNLYFGSKPNFLKKNSCSSTALLLTIGLGLCERFGILISKRIMMLLLKMGIYDILLLLSTLLGLRCLSTTPLWQCIETYAQFKSVYKTWSVTRTSFRECQRGAWLTANTAGKWCVRLEIATGKRSKLVNGISKV